MRYSDHYVESFYNFNELLTLLKDKYKFDFGPDEYLFWDYSSINNVVQFSFYFIPNDTVCKLDDLKVIHGTTCVLQYNIVYMMHLFRDGNKYRKSNMIQNASIHRCFLTKNRDTNSKDVYTILFCDDPSLGFNDAEEDIIKLIQNNPDMKTGDIFRLVLL